MDTQLPQARKLVHNHNKPAEVAIFIKGKTQTPIMRRANGGDLSSIGAVLFIVVAAVELVEGRSIAGLVLCYVWEFSPQLWTGRQYNRKVVWLVSGAIVDVIFVECISRRQCVKWEGDVPCYSCQIIVW